VVLAIHCCLAYMLADTLQSLVAVPFYSLTPELARTDGEVTSLTAWRMLFNLVASLAVALAAPSLVDAATAQGFTPQQGYLGVAALFGGIGVIPFLAIAAVVRERPGVAEEEPPGLVEVVKGAFANRPFRYLAVLYAFNWITFDLVGLMIPFFATWWVSQGRDDVRVSLLGLSLAPEAAALGLMLVLSVPFVGIWSWLSTRIGRRATYMIAMSTMAASLVSMLWVPQGDTMGLVLRGAGCAAGVAAAHVIPDAMIPEVIDWDELQNGKRTEGIYYGAKNLLRKLTGAGAIFFSLQVLGFAGYREAEAGVTIVQPDAALWAIRMLTGPGGALMLVGAIATVVLYPLGRKENARIAAALATRRAGTSPGSPPSA
jgi:GPH family glycoside/pentoside/hexuronide:cation symporter